MGSSDTGSSLIKSCLLSPQRGSDVSACTLVDKFYTYKMVFAKAPPGIGVRYKRDICTVSTAGPQASQLLLIFPKKTPDSRRWRQEMHRAFIGYAADNWVKINICAMVCPCYLALRVKL